MSHHPHTSRTRDAALRRLRHANRWLIGGSAALTGVLTAVAASAFPGKTLKQIHGSPTRDSQRSTHAGNHGSGTATGGSSTLKAPSQAPQSSQGSASTEGSAGSESQSDGSGASTESGSAAEPGGSAAGGSSGAGESASGSSSAGRETGSAAPTETEAPVTSGGS
ncbi:MAG TPA: hypothetical protein VNV42_12950 [Solirubrobacteraceae bacterium]|jgi:hypothetical protein|nr:hypothetical protein [Solirubrobacteraceae bacterium]